MENLFFEKIVPIVGILVLGFFIYIMGFLIADLYAKSECYEENIAEGTVDLYFNPYCIVKEDEAAILLEEIKKYER